MRTTENGKRNVSTFAADSHTIPFYDAIIGSSLVTFSFPLHSCRPSHNAVCLGFGSHHIHIAFCKSFQINAIYSLPGAHFRVCVCRQYVWKDKYANDCTRYKCGGHLDEIKIKEGTSVISYHTRRIPIYSPRKRCTSFQCDSIIFFLFFKLKNNCISDSFNLNSDKRWKDPMPLAFGAHH